MDFTSKVHFEKIEGFVSELPEDLKTTAMSGTAEEVEKMRAERAAEKASESAEKASENGAESGEKNDD